MVDLSDVVAVTRALVDVDSTTGREGEAVSRLLGLLKGGGFAVVEQSVDGDRRNLYATLGKVDVVLSTHIDCVPPFFPSRLDGDRLFGRGSCDAKGIIAAQIAAVESLRRDGMTTVGLLFVVGEERGSDGARMAQKLAPGSKYLINGEPTDNRLGIATRGILRVLLKAKGRASHSSYPELGDSAIEKLLDALVALRSLDLPDDEVMGRTTYNVGVISGGVAPNVVPAEAEAEVMFRTVGDLTELRGTLAALDKPPAESVHRLYNIGAAESEDIRDVIALFEKALGKTAIIELKPGEPGDLQETAADISETLRDFDWHPKVRVEEGIPKFVEWFKAYNRL